MHVAAWQTNYISESGNHAGAAKLPTVATIRNWFLISRVEVEAAGTAGAIVAFGDSITDGTASTPDTNSRWPDVLARRLLAAPAPLKMGILNAGIGGNRVLSEAAYGSGLNALARFEIDVLSQPGVTHSSCSKASTTSAMRGRPRPRRRRISSPATSSSSSADTPGG